MEIPEVCSLRGIRRVVMRRVWERAREAEAKGVMLTHDDFSKMLKEEWSRAIEESRRACKLS